MKMYTGDLLPDLRVYLSGRDAVDIDDALAVRVIGRNVDLDVLFDRAPSALVALPDGRSMVTMQWSSGDTDEVGRIQIEVEVTWPGNKKQTFRAENYVRILADFDLTP